MRTQNMTVAISFLIIALAVAGCGKDTPSFSMLPAGQSFQQTSAVFNNQLDILWVVDNSGSMSPIQTNMVNNFKSFITSFQNKGYDFHMGVTSTDAYLGESSFKNNPNFFALRDGTDNVLYNPSATDTHSGVFIILPTTPNLSNVFLTNATQGQNGSGDERAFSSFRDVLASPTNAGFLRSTSFLAVIVVSDEDDFSLASRPEYSWGNNAALDHCYVNSAMDQVATTTYSGPNHVSTCANQTPPDSVASYEQFLDTTTGTTGAFRRYNVSAITVMDSNCQQQHQAQTAVTIVGQRYMQIAQDTNGILGSICDTSYANSLANIASQIASLSSQFFLNRVPQVNTIVVQVNGATVPQDPANGWTYNSSANSIMFHGTAIPPQNATINVAFTPATIIQ